MRSRMAVGLTAAVLVSAVAARAEELKSGFKVGDRLKPYQVVKCGGAPKDGVKEGQQLCYVWKLGGRPVVTVFAKETGDALASLVKQLDKVVADNKEQQAAAFVNVIGEDREKLEEVAKKFGAPYDNVAVVVPVEFEAGPKDYGVNPEAGVTVLVYRGGKVMANHAIAPGKLDEKAIKAIVEDARKTLGKDGQE